MAELRVRLEAEKATGTEKKHLLQFLETGTYPKPWKP